MADELLVKCRYGWRQVVQLYRDYLDVNTTRYNLADLIYVLPTCRRILGKSSLRLELCFKGQVVVLRGISNLDAAQEMIRYLQNRCSSFTRREQQVLDVWQADAMPEPPMIQEDDVIARWDTSVMSVVQMPTTPLAVAVQHELTIVRHGQGNVEQMGSRIGAREECLPGIKVPLRLLEGENAHYSTPATWCDEPLNDSAMYRYCVKDQGILILTNLRMIYLGRKSQFVLAYAHLVQVFRQQTALAFQAEHRTKREVFTVSSPLECAKYLEHILYRFKRQSQVVEGEALPALVSGNYQSIADSEVSEQQDKCTLADKDTQKITSITQQKSSIVGYEQHMEWLDQLGRLGLL